MKQHRWIPLTASAALIVAIAVSCSGKEKENEQATEAIADLNQPAEIVFFAGSGATEETFNFRVGDSLRKKFPHYKITQLQPGGDVGKNLADIITSGTHLDMVFHSIGNFESMFFPYQLQYDHSELIEKHKVDLTSLERTSLEAVKAASGGNYYGLPVYSEYMVLFYNKSLFDKFGVPYPKDHMTWDQLIELSKVMTRTDSGTQYYGYTQSTGHLLRMNPLSVATADTTANTPLINKEGNWKKLIDTFILGPTTGSGYITGMKERNGVIGQNQFTKDRIVAMFAGNLTSIMIQNKPDLEGLDWDVVSFPTLKENPGIGTQGYPVYFGMTRNAKNKDVQMNILKFLVSEEFQIEQARKGVTPVMMNDKVKQEFGKDSEFKNKNLKALFINKPAPIPKKPLYDTDMINTYNNAINNILLEKVDINTGLRQAEEEASKKIAAYLEQNK